MHKNLTKQGRKNKIMCKKNIHADFLHHHMTVGGLNSHKNLLKP